MSSIRIPCKMTNGVIKQFVLQHTHGVIWKLLNNVKMYLQTLAGIELQMNLALITIYYVSRRARYSDLTLFGL